MNAKAVNRSAELEERRHFEALIIDLSLKFVQLPAADVDREIMDAERRICTLLGLDFVVVWQVSDEAPGLFALTHFFSAQAGPQAPDRMRQAQYPWATEQLLAGRTIKVASLDDLPPEAASDRETLCQFGIKSNLALPLSVGGESPVGVLGLGTTTAERAWPDDLVKRLQLVAQIFAHALARKRAGRALRESEERVALAAEAAELGLWVWNIAGDEVWGSPRWLRLFGFNSGEAVSFENVIQRIHPDDRETVACAVRHAVANQSEYAGEFRAVLPDGSQRWIVSRGRSFPETDGRPARMLGAALDITERKRTEEALRTSEARLAAGTELAGLGYYEIDYAGRSAFMDDRFGEICGIPAELAQSFQSVEFWFKHLHADDLPLISQERQKLHDGNVDRIALEYRYWHPTQGQRWLHHSARVASRRAGGGGIRTFGVIRDITQQKEAELEAKGLRSNLAHADRVTLLGQLASALAHELSQPLGAILRNAEAAEIILQAASPDLEELRAIVTDILRDDKRAGLVIDRLRSLLKRRSLDLQPIELPGVIAEVLSLVQADAAARHVKLACAAAPGLPIVRGDRIHLQQVLLNLLVNAMDALEGCASNQRAIEVRAHRTNPATVEVRVSDNGPGIVSDSFEQLFEPFFTTKAKGMGMGLAVSKTIVEAHQGRLWAENRPEGGACFCFTVPVAEGVASR